jgi:hypothetical protein
MVVMSGGPSGLGPAGVVAAFDVPFDVFAFDDACSCREVIRCFFRRPGTDSVMSFVLRGALKLTFGVVLG